MNLLDEAIKEHLELKRKRGAPPQEVERLEREAFGSTQGGDEAPAGAAHEDVAVDEPTAGVEVERPVEATERVASEAAAPPPAPAEEAPDEARDAQEEGEEEDESIEPFDLEDIFEPEGPEASEEAAGPAEAAAPPPALQPTEEYPAPEAEEEEDEEWEGPDELGAYEPAAEEPSEEWEVVSDAGGEPQAQADEGLAAWDDSSEYDAVEAPAEEAELAELPDEEEDRFASQDPGTGEEDLLEETPEFLKESPHEDELWFDQSPPKDFDFDD